MQDISQEKKLLAELHRLRERVSELEKEQFERKRAEDALKDSEERYRSLFEESIDGVFVTSPEGKILDMSRAGIKMFGYETKEEILSLDLATDVYADPGEREVVLALVRERGSAEYEVRVKKKNKEIMLTRCFNSAVKGKDGKIICYRGVIRDITQIRRAEEELRRTERRKSILDRISKVFLTVPDDEMYTKVLDIVCEATASEFGIFGFIADNGDLVIPSLTREIWGACQVPDKSFVFPHASWGHSLWGKAITEQKTFYSDGPFHIPEGHIRIGNFLTAPIVFAGKTIGLLSLADHRGGYTNEDIELMESITSSISPILNARRQRDRNEQERSRAERELQQSNDLLRAIIEAAPTAIIGLDLDGNVQMVWNPAAERMLGWSAQEVMGRPLPSVPAERQEQFAGFRVLVRKGKTLDGVDVRRQRRDGTPIDYSIYASPLHDAEGRIRGNVAVLVDITEKKQAERERIAHLQFLESMNKVNQAMQGTDDLDQMMSDVLDTVLSIFDCDRAFVLYPCDPLADSWSIPMERTRPEYPGALKLGLMLPMDKAIAETLHRILKADGPVRFGPGTENPLPRDVSERFGFKCFMSLGLYPKVGKPWQFGIHQCSYARSWTHDEERLFEEIGRRLTDRLSSLLSLGELRKSERKLEEAQRIAHLGYWDRDLDAGRVTLSAETCGIFGLPPQEGSLDLALWHQMWQERIHPEDRLRVSEAVVEALRGGARYDLEYRLIGHNGEVRFVSSRGDVTWDKEGRPRRIFGMIQDITERKKAEEVLRDREEQLRRERALLRALIDSIPDLIFFKDKNSVYLGCNKAFVVYSGMQESALIGKSDLEVAPREVAEFFRRKDMEMLSSGAAQRNEEWIPFKNGGGGYFDTLKTPYYDPDGELMGLIGVSRDITEHKRAERIMQARLRLLEFAGSHSMDELLTATLDEIEALTGSSIGFYHFLEPDQKTLALQSWSTNTLKNMCTAEGKGSHYNVANAGVWVDCLHVRRPVIHNDYSSLPHRKGMPEGHAPVSKEVVVPIFRGNAIKAIIGVGNKVADYDDSDIELVSQLGDLSWDIVERKRVEEEVRRLNQELELRVADRTAELLAANNELEAFAYSVSHDLRAPLRHIDGFLELFLQRAAIDFDAKSRRYLDNVLESTKRMGTLIDDLLSFSRMGRYEMSKMRVDLEALVAEVIAEAGPEALGREVHWHIDDLPVVIGDRAMLRIVLSNLVTNALKFTRSCSQAKIEIGRMPGGEDEMVVFVRDNGVGFDMKFVDKLFGVFQRLHRIDEFEGTGIGLANARRIINRHGGRIWADAVLNGGATFYFSLPTRSKG
ncbi:MAG: PAS domain S-box protein [Syntrophobacteraceae bacterium]